MAVLDALRRRQGFTGTDEALADYILAAPDEVADMSIGALAKASHSSNAAVVRLCRKLGLEGYRELRIELARETERGRSTAVRVHPDLPFSEGHNTQDLMSAIAALSRQAVDDTYRTVTFHDVRKAARLIAGARHVVYYANGDSRVSCEMFENLVLKLGILAIDPDRRGDASALNESLDHRDVALVVSYSGMLDRNRNGGLGLDVLVRRGVQIVYLTANEEAPSRLGDVACTILLPQGESRTQRMATYYSQACIRYVLNCIYGELFARDWEKSMALRDAIVRNSGDAGARG